MPRSASHAHWPNIDWLDAPPAAAVERAESLLDRLGATEAMVQQLARYPLHPRLSRILIAAMERGVGEDGCIAAALLGSGARSEKNDLLAAIDADQDYRTRQQMEQLRRIARPARQTKHNDDALLMSVLAGFPDRVARRRAGNQVLLSTGASAEVAGEAPHYEFMVAVDAEDRKDKPLPLIRMTARIEPEWLIELFPDHVREQSSVEWNRQTERVEAVSALLYDELVIQESRGAMPDAEAAAQLLAQKALEAGIDRFVDRDALDEFLARVEFAGVEAPDVPQALRELCLGLRSFTELKSAAANFVAILERKMGTRQLNEIAPAAHPIAQRPADKGSLRTRQAALDRIPPAGFFWDAGNAADWTGADAGGGPPAGSQSASGADDNRPCGLLGAALSAGAPRTDAPVSETLLAGAAVGLRRAASRRAEVGAVSRARHFSDS